MKKIINKKSAENRIKKAFDRNTKQMKKQNKRLDRALIALEHFKNRG